MLWWACALRSSAELHQSVFRRMLDGTLRWFEATPTGRILNRFAKDIDVIDQGEQANVACTSALLSLTC